MLINTKNVKFIIQLFRLSRHPSSLGLKWCSPGVKWGDGIMPLFFLEKIAILNTCCNLKAITVILLISVVFPFILLYKMEFLTFYCLTLCMKELYYYY